MIARRNLWIVFVFFLIFSGCRERNLSEEGSPYVNVHHILQAIPEQDLQSLDAFFQILMRDCNFAYTLFGAKPLSTDSVYTKVNLYALYHLNQFLILEKGWALWEKYSALFPSEEFVLKRNRDDRGVDHFFLISKANTLKMISDHRETFERYLGREIQPQEFLQELCCKENDVLETLNEGSILVGILLGYGEANAALFGRKADICHHINVKMTPLFLACNDIKALNPWGLELANLYKYANFPSPPPPCTSSDGYSSLGEELNNLLLNQEGFELYGSTFFLIR